MGIPSDTISVASYIPSLPSAVPYTTSALTLSVLAVLVASHWVHAVAGGAVGGWTVGLGSREAVHRLDGVASLAAAGRDGVGGVQATVKGRDGEVSLGLWRNPAGVAQDAHHLEKHRRQHVGVCRRRGTCAAAFMHTEGAGVHVQRCSTNITHNINTGLARPGSTNPQLTDPPICSSAPNASSERP